jgi:threonyl-tRNA synthetase
MNEQQLEQLRHSTSHLLAAAVTSLWPETKPTLGPAIENGFYYDFDFGDTKISEEDFPRIEAKMAELAPSWDKFERVELSPEEAKKQFSGNPYKLELIAEIIQKGEPVTIYKSGNFADLCRGGHVEDPKSQLKYFKLLTVAGAYWRGDEKNKMLTRIYGTAFPSQSELDTHVAALEDAKLRDHRIIGKNLNLFVFSDLVGKGLPLFTPKGATIRRELERFVVDEELKRGYLHVVTPPLAKTDLYRTSGHYPYYKETMYPVMKVDEEELILRPMTCPHHFMLYKSQPHSYKELPMRLAEISPQFRYEKSGELTGLMRVRMFCLADAHIFTPVDQAKQVIKEVLDLIDYANAVFGLEKGTDYRYRLSLGDRTDEKKYFKDNPAWDKAEQILREVLQETHAPFYEAAGEAAFYGPKIDVQVKKISGKEETAFTVQYDFVMPQRFDLTYIDKDGQEKRPVVIHRSSIGAFERTMAFLIEKYNGAFPTWLSPVQVQLMPISEKQSEYAAHVLEELKRHNIRVELDDRNESLNSRIRDAQMQKVPYIVVVGDKEAQGQSVSVRQRNNKDSSVLPLSEFISSLTAEIASRKVN